MRNIQPAKVMIYTFIPFCTAEFYFTLGLYQLNEKMNNAVFGFMIANEHLALATLAPARRLSQGP